MARILVIHGAGLDMRGKTQIEIFGTMTLPEYDVHIRRYAAELGVDVEIFQSNVEEDVVGRFIGARAAGFDGAIINPGGFTRGHAALVAAIAKAEIPTIEVHISNPARRSVISEIAAACQGAVAGLGIAGYAAALAALRDQANM